MAKAKAKKQLKVKLVRSPNGRKAGHMQCVRGLGLRHTQHEIMVADTPEVRGMISKVGYLLQVEEV